jgi:uncharacterized Fe-S cluster-containing radical SAM superfamily protein
MGNVFNPIKLAEKLRKDLIIAPKRKVSLANIGSSLQSFDSFKASRIKQDFFRTKLYQKPYENNYFGGKPADVASLKLGIPEAECNNVFIAQINACNLRCWYCYCDARNLCADHRYGEYFTPDQILLHFLSASKKYEYSKNPDEKINILRLSGGEVFLVPELIYWIIEDIFSLNLQDRIFLWIDCNLSTGDFFWKYLSKSQIKRIRNFKNLGICCCYKGFDEESFYYNTGADPVFFGEQFKMHRRLFEEGLDVYSYIYPVSIFPIESDGHAKSKIDNFIGLMQKEVSYFSPLRMAVPAIKIYSANENRITAEKRKILSYQDKIRNLWFQSVSRINIKIKGSFI